LNPQNSPRYHDRRVNDVRVNIDSIRDSIVPEPGQTNPKTPNVLPVGISRVEHKAEDAKVATSAELAAEEQEDDEDDLFVDGPTKSQMDTDTIKDDEVWHAAPAGARTVEVKSETEEDDAMDIDSIPAKVKAPPSPELLKKLPAENVETDARTRAKEKRRERALQDLELQAMNLDTEALLQGLTISGPTEGEDVEDVKEGKLFLFQFPPILPPLRHVNADGNEVVDVEDRTEADGTRIKPDPDSRAPVPTNAGLPPGGGYIGKLNVRKSGKVELDWGGQILDLGIATETDFLTSAIIVDEHESDLTSGQGKATGMGVVFGKFVATPIFDDEEDWEPDLHSLGLEV
jgi:DNA-directed RNA polymerase III subunit RPC4